VRAAAAALLTEWFGERCLDYAPGCYCCEKWKLLDQLTENPFVD
jgi:hypothetical protein